MTAPVAEILPEEVATAAERLWLANGESVRVLTGAEIDPVLRDLLADQVAAILVAPDAKIIELIFDQLDVRSISSAFTESINSIGWSVSALVALPLMGQAHEALRGLSMMIQGWWRDPSGAFKFTGFEVP